MVHVELTHGTDTKHGLNKPNASTPSQAKITDSFAAGKMRGPLPMAKKTEIDGMLQNFIIKDLRPLSTVEGEGFRELLKAFESR